MFHVIIHNCRDKLATILNHHWWGNFRGIAEDDPKRVLLANKSILAKLGR